MACVYHQKYSWTQNYSMCVFCSWENIWNGMVTSCCWKSFNRLYLLVVYSNSLAVIRLIAGKTTETNGEEPPETFSALGVPQGSVPDYLLFTLFVYGFVHFGWMGFLWTCLPLAQWYACKTKNSSDRKITAPAFIVRRRAFKMEWSPFAVGKVSVVYICC